MTTAEIDNVLVQLNNLVHEAIAGQNLQACAIVADMVRNLLKIRADVDTVNNTIEQLKREIRASGREIVEVEKGESSDGEQCN